jgi:hypothetical protein
MAGVDYCRGRIGGRCIMILNRADECRRRANECRPNAAQAIDDMLRGTNLDLARRWRMMAQQAESLEQKELGLKPRLGTFQAMFALSQYPSRAR